LNFQEDDVEVAHRLHQKYAEKGGFDPIDAEFETDFTPEEQALIRFQDETPMYPTLGIMRGNANTLKRPQRYAANLLFPFPVCLPTLSKYQNSF
jgi:hypothetical protein